jgi:hypothetical protein
MSARQPARPAKRKRVAILSSFFRLGQWRGIMRYGQQAGWICQRVDRDTLSRLNTWNPEGLLFHIDEFDTPLINYLRDSNLPKVGLRGLPEPCGARPLVLRDLPATATRSQATSSPATTAGSATSAPSPTTRRMRNAPTSPACNRWPTLTASNSSASFPTRPTHGRRSASSTASAPPATGTASGC